MGPRSLCAPRTARAAKIQQVKNGRSPASAGHPAAAIPFGHEASMVAAAVEVGAALLRQVDAFLLWKRAEEEEEKEAADTSTPR